VIPAPISFPAAVLALRFAAISLSAESPIAWSMIYGVAPRLRASPGPGERSTANVAAWLVAVVERTSIPYANSERNVFMDKCG